MIKKDLKLIEAIIKVYARNVSSMVSNNTIKKDIESISNIKVSEEKIRQLVNKLIDLFIIDEVEPWSPNLRSKSIIRNSNVKYFQVLQLQLVHWTLIQMIYLMI